MLKTKIIAADLQNLTDARYFAAWLVDYMSYNLSDKSVDLIKIKEIMDWVEGPINTAQYSGLEDATDINTQLQYLSIDHIILGPFAKDEIINSDWEIIQTIIIDYNIDILSENRKYIAQSTQSFSDFSANKKSKLKNLCSSHSIFLDCGFVSDDLVEILNLGVDGLVLRGGEEENVGVKSYADLDNIFEALEE